jgi:hypothetical protein
MTPINLKGASTEFTIFRQRKTSQYSEALNSVIYFATLPYKLQDASVNRKFIEETTIKDKQYDVVGVTLVRTAEVKILMMNFITG